MEKKNTLLSVVKKLGSGLKFGLFDERTKAYFEDGEHVSYNALWLPLREIHKLQHHNKSLAELCPATFVGAFEHKFSDHKWGTDQGKPSAYQSFLLNRLQGKTKNLLAFR